MVRRCEASDIEAVKTLLETDVTINEKYGTFDLEQLIATSILSVVVQNDNEVCVGFAAFDDACSSHIQDCVSGQNIDPQSVDWNEWIQEHSQGSVHPRDSIWLACFAADFDNSAYIADCIFQSAFATLVDAGQLLLAAGPRQAITSPLKDVFQSVPVEAVQESEEGVLPQIYSCARSTYIPNIHVRPARVEDHDDLVPIFNNQSDVLSEIYGQFFLAAMIEQQDENTKCLVAEVKGMAVGFISATRNIDTAILKECFDLQSFNNLERSESGRFYFLLFFLF